MPELDLSYPAPWNQQQPDSKPLSLSEAFQLRQRQQQIDAEKALLPLRQQEMQAQIANMALDHKLKQEQMDMALKMKANDAAGWAKAAEVSDWTDPSQVNPIYLEGSKGGGFSAPFTKFLEVIQINAQNTSAKALATPKETPAVEAIQNANKWEAAADEMEQRGNTVQAAKLRRDAQILRGTLKGQSESDTSGVKNAKERLDAYKNVLATSGAPPMTPAEEAAKYQEFVTEQTALPNEETVMQMTPGGGVNVTTRRGGKSGPTTATESKAQTDVMALRSSVQQLENMTATLRPEDVGIAGKIGDVTTRWVRQFAPGVGDPSVISNRTQAEGALNRYLGTQMALGRITAVERERMRNALFDPQRMGQSFDQTIAAANKMKTMQRMDMITLSKSSKQPLTEDMFVGLTVDDYQHLILSRVLTKEEAIEWARKVNPPQ